MTLHLILAALAILIMRAIILHDRRKQRAAAIVQRLTCGQ